MEVKRIPISEAAPGMLVAEDIFNSAAQLIVPRDSVLTDKAIARMRFHSIASFRIYDSTDSAPQKTVPTQERSYFDKLRETEEFIEYSKAFNATVNTLEGAFKKVLDNRNTSDINTITKAALALRNSCRTGIQVFDLLHCFREYDDLTYAHSLNVALICAVEGEWLGFDQRHIDLLVQCALYHDIGKAMVAKELLEKTSPLTPEEKKTVEGHVLKGYQLVRDTDLDQRIKNCIMMHHERCDGSGYPLRLGADKIDDYAKIVAIADVYEAMTSPRAYRKAKCPFEVMHLFETEGLAHFDPKYLMVFMDNIAQSYIGTRVRLNNGIAGTIVFINKMCYSKPMIRVNEKDYIDLSKQKNLYIEAML